MPTRMIFRTATSVLLAASALLACAQVACSSGETAIVPVARGGTAGASGSPGTVGTSGSSAGTSAVTGAGGASGGADAGSASGGAASDAGGQRDVGGGGAGGAGGAGDGGAIAGTGASGGGTVEVYDLKSDWSDAQNPNGPWTVMIGTTVAKNLPNWVGETGQSSYVTASNGIGHIPVLLKVSVSNFEGKLAQKGDLVVHAQDEGGGPGLGQARIVWTAPSAGSVDVDASFWLARTSLKRKDVYAITVAGALKGMGDIPANMGVTRDSPVKFSQKALPIIANQTVELQISRALTCDACSSPPCDGKQGTTCAEFCDYTLKITHTAR
jgi:hypothetical protein